MKSDKITNRKTKAKFYLESMVSMLKETNITNKQIIFFMTESEFKDFQNYCHEKEIKAYPSIIEKNTIIYKTSDLKKFLRAGMPIYYQTESLF